MKVLITALLIVVASSQFACRPLVAGGVGAAVGVAAERERQEDKPVSYTHLTLPTILRV